MELVDGQPLGRILAMGPLSAQVVRYGVEIAAALEDAHDHGLVHGDLKPGNIMATKFGLKLLDFGLARRLASSYLLTIRGQQTVRGGVGRGLQDDT
jgi:serine/threonine-protein kinase